MRKGTALALLNALIDEGVLLPDKKAGERGYAYWRADPDMLPVNANPGITQKRAQSDVHWDGANFLGLNGAWWEAMKAAFPGVDGVTEVTRAEVWCKANRARAPKSRADAFLNSWFAKAFARLNKPTGRDAGRNAAAAAMVGE